MAYYVKQNNASSLVVGTLSASATTLNVTSGEGANFPSSFPYLLTIWTGDNVGDDSGMEIVRCTGRTTDALTIVRAQEGTGDVEHSAGEFVAMLTTAGLFNDATYGVEGNLDTHIALTDVHHTEDHTVVSHSDTTATGAELDELTDGSSTILHSHTSGDVSKVGTPVDNQVGIWTGDGTLEGDSDLTFDGANLSSTGTINNRYIGTDGTKLDTIDTNADVTGDNAPQAHDLDSHNACTIAELSADISDGTLIDTTDSRLSDARSPTAHDLDSHNACTLVELSTDISDNTLIGTDDARLSDSRAPTAHDLDSHNSCTLTELSTDISDATLIDTGDARLSDDRDPTAHASEHTNGTDDIQSATNAQKGVATAAHITAIEANTGKDTNVPTALSVGTVGASTVAITSDGGADDVTLPASTNAAAGMATAAQITKLEGIDTGADVTGDNTPQAHDLNSHNSCTLAELSSDISDATLASTAGTETFTNKIIEIEDILGSDHTYEGITINDTVGESVVFGNLLYMKTDGKWWKASTAVASGAEFPVQAMAMATIAADASGVLLLSGTVRDDSWNFTTLGKLYCGVDVPTHTIPTTSGYTVQIIGTSLDDDNMYFNPSQTYVELT